MNEWRELGEGETYSKQREEWISDDGTVSSVDRQVARYIHVSHVLREDEDKNRCPI